MNFIKIMAAALFATTPVSSVLADAYLCTPSAHHSTILPGTPLRMDGGGLARIAEGGLEVSVDTDRGLIVINGSIYDAEFSEFTNTLYRIRGEVVGGYSGMFILIGDPPIDGQIGRNEKIYVLYNDNTFESGSCRPS